MYIPTPFREDRLDVLHEAMRQNSFATLVSLGPDGLIATHLPLLLDPTRGTHGTLIGHVARENPHWRAFDGDQETLAIFNGPHAYISPSWYTTAYAVPTWNYVTVHAYSRPRLVEDEAGLYDIVAKTVATFEQQFDYAWDLEARRDYAEKLLKNIVGFEMTITRLEGKRKLSQNRPKADQEGVIAGLEAGSDPLGLAVANIMREQIPDKPIANS
jgi:transcriptional regulator